MVATKGHIRPALPHGNRYTAKKTALGGLIVAG